MSVIGILEEDVVEGGNVTRADVGLSGISVEWTASPETGWERLREHGRERLADSSLCRDHIGLLRFPENEQLRCFIYDKSRQGVRTSFCQSPQELAVLLSARQ
jgi:hypothetical protein